MRLGKNCSEYTCRCRMPLQIDLHLIHCTLLIIAAKQSSQMRQIDVVFENNVGRV